jgi:hypothetical protein
MSQSSHGAIDWFIGVVEGDFNEDPSASQIIVGALITAIPFVGGVVNIRDFIANVCKVCKKPDDTWAWVALAVVLLAFIPGVGGVLKGAFGIILKPLRKGGKHAQEALEAMLAVMRGAGFGDPVKYLKALPWADLSSQATKHFNNLLDALLHALSELRQRWLFKTLVPENTLARLEQVHAEILKLKAMGNDQIPKAFKTLRAQVDELLSHAKPEAAKAQSGTQTVIKHSERPLLRVEYELRDAMMKKEVAAMKAAGKTEAEIADYAVQERKNIQVSIREKMDPDLAYVIVGKRNKALYNHPDGPQLKRNAQTGQWEYEKYDVNLKKYVKRSKTDAQVIEDAAKAGGDPIPWDKVLEYTRAKTAGDEALAKRLLAIIDETVMNAFK